MKTTVCPPGFAIAEPSVTALATGDEPLDGWRSYDPLGSWHDPRAPTERQVPYSWRTKRR